MRALRVLSQSLPPPPPSPPPPPPLELELELDDDDDDEELLAVLLEEDDALLDELELFAEDELLLLLPLPPEPPAPESSPQAATSPAVRSERQTSDRMGVM